MKTYCKSAQAIKLQSLFYPHNLKFISRFLMLISPLIFLQNETLNAQNKYKPVLGEGAPWWFLNPTPLSEFGLSKNNSFSFNYGLRAELLAPKLLSIYFEHDKSILDYQKVLSKSNDGNKSKVKNYRVNDVCLRLHLFDRNTVAKITYLSETRKTGTMPSRVYEYRRGGIYYYVPKNAGEVVEFSTFKSVTEASFARKVFSVRGGLLSYKSGFHPKYNDIWYGVDENGVEGTIRFLSPRQGNSILRSNYLGLSYKIIHYSKLTKVLSRSSEFYLDIMRRQTAIIGENQNFDIDPVRSGILDKGPGWRAGWVVNFNEMGAHIELGTYPVRGAYFRMGIHVNLNSGNYY